MKILNANQIRQADAYTIKTKPIASIDLMEHAARMCFNWIIKHINNKTSTFHVFCGMGNNGGDGLVIARKLIESNYKVKTYIVQFKKLGSVDFEINLKRLQKLNAEIITISSASSDLNLTKKDTVIDAIFGNGLTKPPQGFVKKCIQQINNSKSSVIAIDMPSGLMDNNPVTKESSVVQALHTLTFQAPKLCMYLPLNEKYSKNWHVLDIGLDVAFLNKLETNYYTIDKTNVLEIYRKREKFSHKGSFGHGLIIGGSFGKIGAVVLATKATLKIGCGLATAYLPKCGYEIMQSAVPEAMVEVDDEKYIQYFNYKSKVNVIGIGIGLEKHPKTVLGFTKFLKENTKPLVIDADAINILAEHEKLLNHIPVNTVFTPHPKEFQRLVGNWQNDYEKLEKMQEFSKQWSCILILKGHYTAIAYKGKVYFNTTGNSALATGGSGDVLTGYITGLIAQNYTSLEASILAVYLHGLSADIAILEQESRESFMASDNFKYLGKAFQSLQK